jgi:cobalt/nickel transport system permease protein
MTGDLGEFLLPTILAMHAPDRLFSMPVNAVFALVVAAVLAVALKRVDGRGDPRIVPMMGVSGGFIFAAQMLNFPVSAGTTGHLMGGTLAAILLGPWAGTVVMAAIVIVQAIVFQDGGITALGPNIFNMGIAGSLLAYWVYRAVVGQSGQPARIAGGAFFAAWLAVVLAAVFVSLQLAASGTVSLARVLPAMVYTHMVIGIGEGLITAAVVAFVLRTRPDLVHDAREAARKVGRPVVVAGLGAALICAMGLSLLPALWDYPDGLESVGTQQGFLPEAVGSASIVLLPDYTVAGLEGVASTSVAGGIGAMLVFGLSFLVGRLLVRRPPYVEHFEEADLAA